MILDEVEVHLDEHGTGPRRIGVLRSSFTGGRALAGASFEYDADYLSAPDRYALSPDLPLVPGRMWTAENQTLFGAFSDAAPDQWGQKIIEANHATLLRDDPALPRRIGEFDFLTGVADLTRMGALRLRAPGGTEWLSSETSVANVHELDRVLAAAARYEADEATDDDLAYLSDVATSPGGARPKANVGLPGGRLAIAKLPHSKDGTADVEAWEAVALTLARRAGILTPDFDVISASAGKSVLLSVRFDRSAAGERLGYLSAASALGLGAHDDARRTYEDFADTVAELSAAPALDLRELFARVALTVLINNSDDHWKNHGFLRHPEGWRLAPVFDLNPNPRRGTVNARAISDRDDPRDRDIRNLHDIHASFGLTAKDAAAIIGSVAREVAGWQGVATGLGIPPGAQAAMARAFDPAQIESALSLGGDAPEEPPPPNAVWVPPHIRNGREVFGYWRHG